MKIKNWKTTLFGILFLAIKLMPVLGVELPPKVSEVASEVAMAAGLLVAKDKDVTGVGNNARTKDKFE